MKTPRILLAALIALGFAASAHGMVTNVNDQFRKDIEQRAAELGQSVQTDQMLTIVRDGATIALASPEGYEQVDPQEMKRGVDFAFGYINAPTSGIAPGYYTLRATAENGVNVGRNDVRIDFIDASGRVAATRAGQSEVFSLTVPDALPFPQTVIESESLLVDQRIRISIWVRCPNGSWICFSISIEVRWFGLESAEKAAFK